MPFPTAKIIRLPDVDSTNNYAAKLLITSNPQEGTAILARHQTKGRGQRGNYWEDDPGKNLLCSFILYPEFLHAGNHFRLSQAVALAICDTLSTLGGINLRIKWPNDIIAEDRKISGILIETNLSGTQIQSAIVGIGINVNQRYFNVPWATSLYNLYGREFDVEEVFSILNNCLFRQYQNLKKPGKELEIDYHRSIYRLDEIGTYKSNGNSFQGIIRGTDPTGKLMMEINQGEIITFYTHEVSMEY